MRLNHFPLRKPESDDCYEGQRIDLLGRTHLVDTGASDSFDRITRLAASVFGVPIALVSLVDGQRQWFKSTCGLDIKQTDRETSFCTHAIEQRGVMVVEDAAVDPRFLNNPLVTGSPGIRFYAGAPLVLPSGHALGTLCIIDRRPRLFGPDDQARLADMAALVMAQIDLHQQTGRVDAVTRLPNRTQLLDDLDILCGQHGGEHRVLMLIDVISQAQLQSAFLAVGARPLEGGMRAIARKLELMLGADTRLYQVSETRFSFLLPGQANPQSDDAATLFLDYMREPFSTGGVSVELEVHAGLVAFRLERKEIFDVLRKATSALQESVSSGTTVAWHQPSFDTTHRRSYDLLKSVGPGLQNQEFRLVFQPKFDLRSGAYYGVEALARWTHPTFGDISPAEFIPLIESTALIHEFTRWVVDTSLVQLQRWQAQGLELTIAVNVSSRNLEDPDFLEFIRTACASKGVSPSRLNIECTEHSVMTSAATQRSLQALRAMGSKISLDDFGMGYSNLVSLNKLPVQLLKIDQSLIRPITADASALALVSSLIQLGHALGFRVLAEGVESRETLDLLAQAGCDAAQGYFLSRPLEATALLIFMLDQSLDGQTRQNPASGAEGAPMLPGTDLDLS